MKQSEVQSEAIPTEERIKNAAREVFLEKGYEGATTREIADRAGMNRALMNYYFRSKEKLFNAIFEEELKRVVKGMQTVLATDLPLKEKIVALINNEFNLLTERQHLACFILQESSTKPELYGPSMRKVFMKALTLFSKQVQEAVQAGIIRPISAEHLIHLIRTVNWTLFMEKAVLMQIHQLNEQTFQQFALEFKQASTEILIHGLFLK